MVDAEETVTRASELNNGEEELRVDTETADDDAIKDDIPQDALVSSNDKLHIEQVCKAHKGERNTPCPCSFSVSGAIERPVIPAVPKPLDAIASNPFIPYIYSIKHPLLDRVKPSFVIF